MSRTALLGALIGLATLSKASALALLPLTLVAIGVHTWGEAFKPSASHRLRSLVKRSAVTLVTASAVCGWWYARNGLLYQDPLGFQAHFETWWRYEEPLPLSRLWNQLCGVALTFWAAFGMGNIHLPAVFYAFTTSLVALAFVGLVVWVVQAWQLRKRPGARAWQLTSSAFSCRVFLAALLQWMQLVKAALGRLLFPAIGAVTVLMIWGLTQSISYVLQLAGVALTSRPLILNSVLTALVVILFCTAAVAPCLAIRPAYARPALLSQQEIAARMQSTDIRFGDSVHLIGFQLGRHSTHPGKEIAITLCWEALAPTEMEYAYFVHLLGPNNSIVGARNTYPGLGRFPTTQWTPGDAFCDVVRVPAEKDAPVPAVYDVEIGYYEPDTDRRLPAYDSDGSPMDLVILDRIRLVSETPLTAPIPHRIDANLGDRAKLLGYSLSQPRIQRSEPLTVTLFWEAQTSMKHDHTVFVHLARAGAVPCTQDDSKPRNGSYPTPFWKTGEVIVDEHTLQIPESLPPGSYQLLTGMYLPDSGNRLLAADSAGTRLPEDAISLARMDLQ